MIRQSQILHSPSPRRLILLAAVVQVVITASVYTAGRLRLVQSVDGNGCIMAFTPDGLGYLWDAHSLSCVLTGIGPRAWLTTPAYLHIRLYSVSLSVLSPLVGTNILSA